jgi:hypothetical protein
LKTQTSNATLQPQGVIWGSVKRRVGPRQLLVELLNLEPPQGIERSAAVERLERFELVEARTGCGKNLADF